jgi:hypothetical protein
VLSTGTFNHFVLEGASGTDTASSRAEFGAFIQELGIASDSPFARLLWELINDSQSVTWQNIQSAGAVSWATIQASSDGTWAVVNSFENADWTNVNTSETTNWQDTPTTS